MRRIAQARLDGLGQLLTQMDTTWKAGSAVIGALTYSRPPSHGGSR